MTKRQRSAFVEASLSGATFAEAQAISRIDSEELRRLWSDEAEADFRADVREARAKCRHVIRTEALDSPDARGTTSRLKILEALERDTEPEALRAPRPDENLFAQDLTVEDRAVIAEIVARHPVDVGALRDSPGDWTEAGSAAAAESVECRRAKA
jgi:hypothetical protein